MPEEKRFYLYSVYGLIYLGDGFSKEEMKRHFGTLDHDYGYEFNTFIQNVPILLENAFGQSAQNVPPVPYVESECGEPRYYLMPSFSSSLKCGLCAVCPGPKCQFFIASTVPIGKPFKIGGLNKSLVFESHVRYDLKMVIADGIQPHGDMEHK